jgi:hypothetical protein
MDGVGPEADPGTDFAQLRSALEDLGLDSCGPQRDRCAQPSDTTANDDDSVRGSDDGTANLVTSATLLRRHPAQSLVEEALPGLPLVRLQSWRRLVARSPQNPWAGHIHVTSGGGRPAVRGPTSPSPGAPQTEPVVETTSLNLWSERAPSYERAAQGIVRTSHNLAVRARSSFGRVVTFSSAVFLPMVWGLVLREAGRP